MTEKRKYERSGLSTNDKRNKFIKEANLSLSIFNSWILLLEDGSFEPTRKFTKAVNEFFDELHSTDSQTDASVIDMIEKKKRNFSDSFLCGISEVTSSRRLPLDSLIRLHNIYKDQFVNVTEHPTPFENNIIYITIQVLLKKCEWNKNRNGSDRNSYKSGNILYVPFLSLLSYACSLNGESCNECEAMIWGLFHLHVVQKRNSKVINKEFLSLFMYDFSEQQRFYLNRQITLLNLDENSSYHLLQNELLTNVDLFINPLIKFFLKNYPNYYFETSFLLSVPLAQSQKNIHKDFTNDEKDECFTVIIPINLSCSILLFDKNEKSELIEVQCGQYLKFSGECAHCGGPNKHNAYQFRIQILFAKQKVNLPPFDTVELISTK